MAEKEERIYTFTKEQMCNKCKEICAEWDGLVADCGNCGYVLLHSMTRQEAIECMAKGIVSILAVQPGTEPDPWEMWKDYAEAALNALLSSGE